jgi:hypothetical protein
MLSPRGEEAVKNPREDGESPMKVAAARHFSRGACSAIPVVGRQDSPPPRELDDSFAIARPCGDNCENCVADFFQTTLITPEGSTMAATSGFAVTWIWLLMMSGAGAIPVGGAPLPLDPVLSKIAPEECLWYASYSGQSNADPNSANQTEQLFAEPQVTRFIDEIQSQVMKAARRAGGPEREKRVIVEQAPKLLRALLTRPSVAYVEEVKPREGEGVDVSAAFVLNAGDQQDEVKAAIAELLTLIPPDRPERMDGDAPAWLTDIRTEHPIERELSLGYLNVAGVLERVRPLAEAKDPKAWPAVETLGLTHIRAIHGVSGYDDVACKSIAHIVTDGQRAGLLGLLPYKPLEAANLQPIPKHALFAVAKRADAAEVWDHAVKMATELEPKAKEKLEKTMWEIETHLGVNVRDDILASLGDVWTIHLPGGELMLSWLNATLTVQVKDADKLGKAVEKLVDVAQAEMVRHPNHGAISESKLGDRTLYTFQLPNPAPISPSWCVGDGWLVFSLSPASVQSTLDRKAADSLAEVAAVQAALTGEGGASILAYQDTPQLVESVYPWLQMGVQMAAGQLRKNGVEIDPTILPARDVILKHLRPGVATLSHSSDGFHITSRHSLPGGGNLAAAAPVGAALLLPAAQGARGAAQSAQSQNNMKQIALAMHMYHDAHKKFPADTYSEDGKPLFSWRVHLLPYLEQAALYEKLKLDEPWDSEHNRQFTSTVIPTFDSPSKPGHGKTRYLALKGPDSVFAADKVVQFRNVTDGLSNTIAFVEADPDRAVPWAKPADIKFNAEKPLEGLASPDGAFLAALCDGSVRRLKNIDAEALKAMVTFAGGEPAEVP